MHPPPMAACTMPPVSPGQLLPRGWRVGPSMSLGFLRAPDTHAGTCADGRRGIIEVYDRRIYRDLDTRARLLRVADTANRVGHPGAPRVLDVGLINDGPVFVVLEPIEGRSVRDLVEESFAGRLGLREALRIVDGVLSVLAAAHARGIVHGHLHAGRLILGHSGVVQVLDFGIAGELLRREEALQFVAEGLAPELAQGAWDRVDGRTDLWAVGALLFEILAGRAVRETEHLSAEERRRLPMTEPVPPSLQMLPDLPAEVAEVIDRALAFAPEQRWPDAVTMQAAVRRALERTDDRTFYPASRYSASTPVPARAGGFVSPAAVVPLRVELPPSLWRRPSTLAAGVLLVVVAAIGIGAGVRCVGGHEGAEPRGSGWGARYGTVAPVVGSPSRSA